MANKFGIINKGKLLVEISKEDLENENVEYYEICTDNVKFLADILAENNFNNFYIESSDMIRLYDEFEDVSALTNLLYRYSSLTVTSVQKKVGSIEDYYFKLTGGN